ncbi:MAG: GTPase [Gemmataceae bacterium]
MSRWRIALVAGLILIPFLCLAGVGSYYLWSLGFGWLVWTFFAGCLAVGYGLGWYWQHKRQLLHPLSFSPLPQWTLRDREAWKLVEARAQAAAKFDPDRFSDLNLYVDTAREMTQEMARLYNPGAADPLALLTLPEMLTVIELAAQDLAEMVDRYLPGGHLLTLRDWRRARQAMDWYQTANNIYWLISAAFSPLTTGLRYAASQVGLSTPLRMLQNNLLLWFYSAYVHRLGTYLVELNSGRLRVGARRYRELTGKELDISANGKDEADEIKAITITILGQVKAGKSSFVNALLGEQRAKTDVLPATDEVTKYLLKHDGVSSHLLLLDTVGYAHEGPKADQVRITAEWARQSDLLVLVTHACNPARQADLAMLEKLRAWFAGKPDLRMPPVIGVLSHIDLLSPAMEWSPPYDWCNPTRPKEQHIQDALASLRGQLEGFLAAEVPVCTAPGKVYGIEEYFLPALAALLDEVHAIAFLRCLKAEINAQKMQRVFYQLLQAGKGLARVAWSQLSK